MKNSPLLTSRSQKIHIVNVSSLAAIQAFESWGIYCAGKAARDMLYKVIAKELAILYPTSTPIKLLNYAPGPLDTDMQKQIREGEHVDKANQQLFIEMQKNNQLIDPAVSAEKMIAFLAKDEYASGDHVDFFDL